MVKAFGQIRYLVLSLRLQANIQFALAPALHTALQGLQTPRQAPHNGVGG